MATKKKKKLQIKDLEGKKVSKKQAATLKGGKPKIICLTRAANKWD